MITMWALIALGVAAVVVAVVASSWSEDRRSDLGSVSHQWIAEHRFGTRQDSGR